MNKMQNEPDPLRAEAEAQLVRARLTDIPVRSAEELLHELQVHQIELEMQNDELRRAQLALEESRDRYVDLYEFAPVGYLTLSREGMISEANLTGAALLGVERKKLLQRRFDGFVAPEGNDHWQRHFLNVLQRDGQQSCELALRRGDGARFHARLDCLRMEADSASSVRIVLTDITEHERAEQELRIAAIAFESQEGMIVADTNGVILRVNRAFTQLTGYSEEEAVGKTPAMLKSGRQDKAFYQRMWTTLKQKHCWQGEVWNKRKDGKIYAEWLAISAVIAASGSVTHYIGTFFDLSERKFAEQQLRELSAHMQTVREEEKTNFAREIHDDLGSTLAALKMDASWLARKLPAEAEMLPLRECAKSMIDLLDNAVLATRRIITDLRPTLLDDLGLLATLEWKSDQFRKRSGIECRVVCIEDKSHKEKLDKALSINLYRIFQETLTNVARHSGASKVEVGFRHSDEEVTLSISDNGRGLAEGHTVASTSYGIRGMRERVVQLGGEIKFNHPPGGGFSVMVKLPLPAAPQ